MGGDGKREMVEQTSVCLFVVKRRTSGCFN